MTLHALQKLQGATWVSSIKLEYVDAKPLPEPEFLYTYVFEPNTFTLNRTSVKNTTNSSTHVPVHPAVVCDLYFCVSIYYVSCHHADRSYVYVDESFQTSNQLTSIHCVCY